LTIINHLTGPVIMKLAILEVFPIYKHKH
jgi:hypothetical protein